MNDDETLAAQPTVKPEHVSQEAVHLALSLCTGLDARHDLRRPWRHGEHVYASNGIIIARVPAVCAPWVHEEPGRRAPGVDGLPWAPELYGNSKVYWPRLKPAVVKPCEACEEEAGDDYEPTVYSMTDLVRAVPCPTCAAIAAEESDATVSIGGMLWRLREVRKLWTIGADLYPPLNPAKEGNAAGWRWEVPDLCMVGIVLPMKGSRP